MTVKQILKYPRTLHLRGSTPQQGDDPDQMSMASLKGKGNFVFEEKADGANAGLSFDPDDGDMVLQSRGHSLDGGGRERQFDIFKSWAQTFERDFREALSTRYVAYGEWMATKHSEFYDNLPHLFLSYGAQDGGARCRHRPYDFEMGAADAAGGAPPRLDRRGSGINLGRRSA